MSTISVPFTFSSGAVIVAAEHNSCFTTIYNDYNGSISNANLSASAAIVDTKLATISTAGKVNLSGVVITSQAGGDVIYASSASALTRLAKGTAYQVLGMNSGATLPEWQSLTYLGMPAGSVVNCVNNIADTTFGTAADQAYGSVDTGVTVLPFDDSIPQKTEGNQFMQLAITPKVATHKLKIEAVFVGGCSTARPITVALFQDATAGALAVSIGEHLSTGEMNTIPLTYYMAAGTVVATTFKVRVGVHTAGTITLNGHSAGRIFGGVAASSMTITEIVA